MARRLQLYGQIIGRHPVHAVGQSLHRHHDGIQKIAGEHIEQAQQAEHHQEQRQPHPQHPLGHAGLLHKGDDAPAGVGQRAHDEQMISFALALLQGGPPVEGALLQAGTVGVKPGGQLFVAHVAEEQSAVFIQQQGGAHIPRRTGALQDLAHLGGGEVGHQFDVSAPVGDVVRSHGAHQHQLAALLGVAGELVLAGVVAADDHIVGPLHGGGVPAFLAQPLVRHRHVLLHRDAAALLHEEVTANDVLGRDHGGVEGLFQPLAVEILLAAGAVVDLVGQLHEFAVVHVHKMRQLQRGGLHVGVQGSGHRLLKGGDGVHRRGPHQMVQDHRRHQEHHDQRDHHQQGKHAVEQCFQRVLGAAHFHKESLLLW